MGHQGGKKTSTIARRNGVRNFRLEYFSMILQFITELLSLFRLPLAESKQQYSAMDLHLRKEFHSMMEKISTARNLEHITYPSFTLLQGFRTKYQAADYVYSMLALLSNNVSAAFISRILFYFHFELIKFCFLESK